MEPSDLGFRILKVLLDWERSGNSSVPDAAQLSVNLGVQVNDVVDQLDILEAEAAVKVTRTFGDRSNNAALITGVGKRMLQQVSVPAQRNSSGEVNTTAKQNQVFVVHGRNITLRQSMFEFLRAIGLNPIEWNHAIAATKKTSPYIGEILDAAFSQAEAIVVLASGDDEAKLMKKFANNEDPAYEKDLTPQPRPNVLFEAGLAMGRNQDRTILVEIGNLRPWSDIAGRHITRLDNSRQKREELANKLKVAGCDVDLTGQEWLTVGDFELPPEETPTEDLANHDIATSQPVKSFTSQTADFNFSGTGSSTTRAFTVELSPWRLRYRANWNGHFAVQVSGKRIELVINRGVLAGKTYETYVHDHVGSLRFSIEAPPDGDWTLLVIPGEK